MKRRSFLKSAAALLPAAGMTDFVLAQAAAPSSTEVHVVGADEDRFGEHHSLGFSTIRFKVATGDSGGSVFVIEHEHLLKGGPPLHVHFHQDEWFYVMEGEVLFQVGSERKRLGPGESVLGPRRHSSLLFWSRRQTGPHDYCVHARRDDGKVLPRHSRSRMGLRSMRRFSAGTK